MSRRSANELAGIGVAALGADATVSEVRIIKAVADMLAYAAPPMRRSPKPKELPELPVSPRTVFGAIEATQTILCSPVDNRWFGRLGGLLKNVRVEVGDLEVLTAWLTSGGVAGWPQGKPTFTQLLQHLDKWLAFSQEWNRRDRPALNRTGSRIGMDIQATADLSAFRAPRVG